MPVFSVIIPCYNCSHTLRETLDSVLSQSFRDLEIVAVDDGSTDATAQILQETANREPDRVILHRQANAGVSAARNAALRLSRGAYILFLDSDDLLAEGLLEAIDRSLKQKPADTLCFFYTRDQARLDRIPADCRAEPVPVSALLERLTYSKRDVQFCCFVYKTELLKRHSLRYAEGYKYGEDWEFATKYLSHCAQALILRKNAYYYRQTATSAMAKACYDHVDAISAADRTHAYLMAQGHPFASEFGEYMYPRAAFSVAHKFGQVRNRELFNRLRREYDMRTVMVRMVKNANVDIKSKLAASAYLVSPWLYYLISIF